MSDTAVRRGHGPWVDVHAHPGRCFLAALEPDEELLGVLGSDACDQVVADFVPAGMAAVAFATVADLRVLGARAGGGLCAVRDFRPGEVLADHCRQLAGIKGVAAAHGLSIVETATDITAAHEAGTTSVLVTCEGADFVEDDLDRVVHSHAAGVRSITVVHYRQNPFGDLQTEPPLHGGLSPAGRNLVKAMNEAGMIVDLAHATYATTMNALEVSQHPVMISHTHLGGGHRTNPRLISHAHAAAVAAAGGLIGAWPSGVSSETFDDFVDEIARLVEAIGVDHVGIGTDMDANYRPVVTEYGQFAAIDRALAGRGFTEAEADKILGGNAVALVKTVCGG